MAYSTVDVYTHFNFSNLGLWTFVMPNLKHKMTVIFLLAMSILICWRIHGQIKFEKFQKLITELYLVA